jgi:hypothetical protein
MSATLTPFSVQALETLNADPPAAYLDPDELSAESKRAAEAFQVEGTSPNTRRTYQTALLNWGAWYALRDGRLLTAPVSVPTVIQFILDHLKHNPLEEPVEPSPFVPSNRTTQHLLPPAIDRVLVARAYKAKLGAWSRATVETRLAALSRAHDVFIANQVPPLPAEANPLRDPGGGNCSLRCAGPMPSGRRIMLAEQLDEEQAAENYEGPEAITLGKLSANLSAQASTLRTLALAQAIANSADAVQALTTGTAAANKATQVLKEAETAIQIAGLVLSLGAAVISRDPAAVIAAGSGIVTAVKGLSAPSKQ